MPLDCYSLGGSSTGSGHKRAICIAIVVWSLAAARHALARELALWFRCRPVCSALGSAKREISPPPSRRWRSGSRRRSARSRRASSTPARTSARWSAPLMVPWITLRWGWEGAFIVTGDDRLCLAVCGSLYRRPDQHPRLDGRTRIYQQRSRRNRRCASPGRQLLPHRQTWAFAIGKLLTDPIWWLYLFWLPDFLNSIHGLDFKNFGPADPRSFT